MAEKNESLDFLTRLRIRDLVLLALITASAVLANLPQEFVRETLGIDPTTVLAFLAIAVIIGLFLVLRLGLFVAVVLLVAGANMPEQIAEGLNISRIPIVLALAALIGIGVVNYFVKLMPTGLEPRGREKSREGIRALFYAIDKDNLVYAQKVLAMNFDPNLHHENGYTPLAFAATKGSVPMLELLLRNGADASMLTREGDTPVELALRMGHNEAAELLRRARQGGPVEPAAAPPERTPQLVE